MENSRKYSEEQIQKEHDKEKEYLKSCYENNKEKIEQIREIIIQNSLSGKMSGEFSVFMMVVQSNVRRTEFQQIYNYFDSIGVTLSISGAFYKCNDERLNGEFVNIFTYEFQND